MNPCTLASRSRRIVQVVVIVAATVSSGCGRDSGPGQAAERLNAAIAAVDTLPPGWVDSGTPVGNAVVPIAGDGHGYCGGGNHAMRALGAGSFVIAHQHGYRTGDDAAAWITVLDFDRELSAVAFMHATADETDCDRRDYEFREWVDGAEPDDGPVFIDLLPDSLSLDGRWRVTETTTTDPSLEDGDVFAVERAQVFAGVIDGSPVGESWRTVERWERHGTVVLAFGHAATHDVVGATTSDNVVATAALPTVGDLVPVADHFRDPILTFLTDNPRPDDRRGDDTGSL